MCALVASDGRLHSGAYYENGTIISNSKVIQDQYDKTFELVNGRLIGCVAGTMEFDGKKVGQHLLELLIDMRKNESIVFDLCDGLKNKLEEVRSDEIAYCFRKVDLMLIHSVTGAKKDLKIYAIRFSPKNDLSSIEYEIKEVYPEIEGHVAWQLFGDDLSQKAVDCYLHNELKKMVEVTEQGLRSLMYKAVRLGIKESGVFSQGVDKSCGGKVFVKSIK
jgi:hypothetical protein